MPKYVQFEKYNLIDLFEEHDLMIKYAFDTP